MNFNLQQLTRAATGASDLRKIEQIQSLWSGYGEIARYGLKGCAIEQVVIKHVKPPRQGSHPRGWNTDLSHQRKMRSYQVESSWYRDWAERCDDSCRIPHCLALESDSDEFLMVLEDLNTAGYPARKGSLSLEQIQLCLGWLANFHATFMGAQPTGLWPIGTYWHLATRPDEWQQLANGPLKRAAAAIDQRLTLAHYQTVVHGDAKLANFCFSDDGKRVAAVDFQYVGGGCGMKDVAYFIGSCLDEVACERYETLLLDSYFTQLNQALMQHNPTIRGSSVEQEWRPLYPVAWTDFHRFIKGWSPGHWKIHSYSERVAHGVVAATLTANGPTP